MFKPSDVLQPGYQLPSLSTLRQIITDLYIVDENAYLADLIQCIPGDDASINAVTQQADNLIQQVREKAQGGDGIDAFLQQYTLDTQEGIILMCLAEALLRIPDAATADALIKDKLSGADWSKHLSQSDSVLVNASTWGLLLTGKVIKMDKNIDGSPAGLLGRMVNRLGEPVVRQAMYAAMKIMGKQFVLGRTIEEAQKNARKAREKGYTQSYDMLGEGALTHEDAIKYFDDYYHAIESIGTTAHNNPNVPKPTISIKLSALHPRYEVANIDRVLGEMADSVLKLIAHARKLNVGIQIDAEEADRLELSLSLFEKLYRSDEAKGWGQLGIVVQAYSKRALPVLMWITKLAQEQGDIIPLRLVKGAYWDTEIKLCQERGLQGYPVFTRKPSTDVSYLACARFLLSAQTEGVIYPQFATHNAHTVVAIRALAGSRQHEFQRLHGMGRELYDTVIEQDSSTVCRIYAPVGAHRDLLPYLVRRLLENGANSSFVHKLVDPKTPIDSLTAHPLVALRKFSTLANEKIVLPPHIFGAERLNSEGVNMTIESQAKPFFDKVFSFLGNTWQGASIIDGEVVSDGELRPVYSPQNRTQKVGDVRFATSHTVEAAVSTAHHAFNNWSRLPVATRAAALDKAADLLEANKYELIALCGLEAGKSLQDGIDEVREAVDFCRYYAQQARDNIAKVEVLPGPTGEKNELFLHGRGVFVCISPWNFPLAIFLGQVVAALVTGNTVVAKPAEQTNLVAFRAVQLLIEAGVPGNAIQLLLGEGHQIGNLLTGDRRIAGVCFTGSTTTAWAINRSLANREHAAIAPLIAETGGQNAMIVDSTALAEQVVKDVVRSSFASAGQRCSACRVLFVQDDIADRVIDLLKGAMAELVVGDPMDYKTDVGPVIDNNAKANLEAHIANISSIGKLLAQATMPAYTEGGNFVVPTAVEIDSISRLEKEHFGPILHVIRFKAAELDKVIDDINNTGFGLTLGIHSRNESLAFHIADRANVGNAYINRNQIGAVVGVNPFGGQGLSGTGPKAGGPHYLFRFVTEKTRTNNLTASGGNATLLALGDC